MKFDSDLKPWLAASTDESRLHLVNLKYEVEKRRLLATNGHILVSVPVTPGPEDKSGLLTVDCVRWAADHMTGDDVFIDCSAEGVAVVGDVTFKRPREDDNGRKFPPADDVFPRFEKNRIKTHMFAFDAALLLKLANALGKGEPGKDHFAIVQLTVKAEDGMIEAIEVVPQDGVAGAIGLLMPCKS